MAKGTCQHPKLCCGAPLRSLAPTPHPDPLLHRTPDSPTPPPCSAAPPWPLALWSHSSRPTPVRRWLLRAAGHG